MQFGIDVENLDAEDFDNLALVLDSLAITEVTPEMLDALGIARDVSRLTDHVNTQSLEVLARCGGLDGAEIWTCGGSEPDSVVHHVEMLCLEGSDEPTPVLMGNAGGWRIMELHDLGEMQYLQPAGVESYAEGGTVALLKAHAARLNKGLRHRDTINRAGAQS
jgi:hypothetical protein